MYSESFIKKHGLKLGIVGRPNVGKSTLFNRLCGKKLAIVHDTPGVTRDRRDAFGQLGDLPLWLMDTAGLVAQDEDDLMEGMRIQAEHALDQSEMILFMTDARMGITPQDETLAKWIRGLGKPVVLVTNKCEGAQGDEGLYEAYSLGLGEPVPISSEHGLGMDDLYQALVNHYKGPLDESEMDEHDEEAGALQLAIVGRPNVGKSTLINKLLGEERLLTGPEAGVTRDSIAIDWEYNGQSIRLHDTAGMRKKTKVTEKVERMAVADSLRAIQYAQVAVLLLDATQPFERQDQQIGAQVVQEGRCLVVALNKWDLVENKQAYLEELRYMLDKTLPQIKNVPCISISAKNGKNLDKLMASIFEVYELWNKRIPTAKLNEWLEHLVAHHPPPLIAGRRLRIKYITQIKTRPPTFVLFCSKALALPDSYTRYLINGLREDFKLDGVPLRMMVKSGKNPYVK